ncbi:hypothetical protein MNBD_GAMMA04-510 [hydrothermal vent metagenome]|uniref:Uncharacterized protein n=1 Tax=hydrothermal vent metagenome TaxID=652676 RepID=A0A3B0WDD7_9ZZZZ
MLFFNITSLKLWFVAFALAVLSLPSLALSVESATQIKEPSIMATPPVWEDNFEQGWNAVHSKGALNNRSDKAKKWRFSQMQNSQSGQVIPDPNASKLRPNPLIIMSFYRPKSEYHSLYSSTFWGSSYPL